MRQRPKDVQNTTRAVHNCALLEGEHIVCVDYSDFNNTHTTRSRALLNLAFAKAYNERGQCQQATAALWMTAAQLQHTLDGCLSSQGLSSGERDTARDNTILHWAYRQLVLAEMRRDEAQGQVATVQICGDDEIVIGMEWARAALYIQGHATQGHAIQKRKIMVSKTCGEFLQYNMFTKVVGRLPRQPLPPALNNFVSGSWYKTAAYSAAAYPQQVAEAAGSCIRRGADAVLMTHLVAATCNWLCKGTQWREALAQTNIFRDKRIKAPQAITTSMPSKLDEIPDTHWPAIADYVRQTVGSYSLNDDEIGIVRRYARENITATAKASIRTSRVELPTIDARTEETRKLEAPEKMTETEEAKILQDWLAGSMIERTDMMTWMAVQLGIPLPLVKNLGVDKIVRIASNEKKKHLRWPEQIMKECVSNRIMALLPGAIAPAFTTEQVC
jgi:hypothetical protein